MDNSNKLELITSPKSNQFLANDQRKIFLDYLSKSKNKFKNSDILHLKCHSFQKTQESLNYSEKCYEEIMNDLTSILNEIHEVNWSKKAWKILIGPWLIKFISIVNDRIEIVQEVLNIKNVNFSYSKEKETFSLASKDIREFGKKVVNYDWNDELFSRIFLFLTNQENLQIFYKKKNQLKFNQQDVLININYLKKIKNFFQKKINEKNKYFFFNTYIGNLNNRISLSFKLGEIPVAFEDNLPNFRLQHNFSLREKLQKLNTNSLDYKQTIIRSLIIECLPSLYFENFKNILNYIQKDSALPLGKKIIITANCWGDSYVKFWIAHQSTIGSKVLYLQHGGGYGMIKRLTQERHENDICDKYYSWGWGKEDKKIYPGMISQTLPLNKKNNSQSILIVTGTLDYFQWTSDYLYSIEKEKNLNKNSFFWSVNFIDELLKNTSIPQKYKNIEIRLHPLQEKRGSPYSLKKELRTNFPELKFSNHQNKTVIDIIELYDLIVFAYPFATPFFQCLALGKPTIAFSPLDKAFIRDSARPDFQKMIDLGIYYDEPKKCADFLNKNFKQFDKWNNSLSKEISNIIKTYANFNRNCQLENLVEFIKFNKFNQ